MATGSASNGHFCVVMSDAAASVRCWGRNDHGQCGNGVASASLVVMSASVPVMTGVAQITLGDYFTCVLTQVGGVRCWGDNLYGQLGNGYANSTYVVSPPSVDVLAGVSLVAAGFYHTCAIVEATAGVRCWGSNGNGQVGNASLGSLVPSPPVWDLLTGVAQVAGGVGHTCVLLSTTGGIRCWGYNNMGQLGIGSASSTSVVSPPSVDVVSGILLPSPSNTPTPTSTQINSLTTSPTPST